MTRSSLISTVVVALATAPVSFAVTIDFDLPSGTLVPNPPPEVGPPDHYHSHPIGLPGPLLIEPGQTGSVWVLFKDMLHLEVIDAPPNTDGVERLRTHVRGRVIPDPSGNDFTELWVDVTLSGASGHVREAFGDPGTTHPRRPLNTNDNPNAPPIDRGGASTGQGPVNDDPIGDWDGADDDSGSEVWIFHQDVIVDKELHAVGNGFTLETWADDLTDEQFLFHDIHWDITNHGPNAVEIFSVEFWQDGNIVQIGVWVPEPSSAVLVLLAGWVGLNLRIWRV